MRRPVLGFLTLALVCIATSSAVFGQSMPEFRLGFKALADQIPQVVGKPIEEEHYGPNGDSLQQTTSGLMAWRKADNWTAFTNGSRTWVNGPFGVMERANEERFEWESQEGGTPVRDSRILFVSDRDGREAIYIMNEDGSAQRRLSGVPAGSGGPAWSLDHTKVAFSMDSVPTQGIYVMNADGTGVRRLTSGVDHSPAWSPDGKRVTFSCYEGQSGEICTVAEDGSNRRRLTSNSKIDQTPTWSADGRTIAFACEVTSFLNLEICLVDPDGTNLRTITRNPGMYNRPAWSPDGTKIAFTGSPGGMAPGLAKYTIYIMNGDGSGITRLTGEESRNFSPTWSADGMKIAFQSDRDGDQEIYQMNSDGSGQTRLTNNTSMDQQPSW